MKVFLIQILGNMIIGNIILMIPNFFTLYSLNKQEKYRIKK